MNSSEIITETTTILDAETEESMEAAKCSCGVIDVNPLGHGWSEATCQKPKACKV